MLFLTHQITLDLTRGVPSSHNAADEQGKVSLSHVDIHIHVKTAVDHTELLLMQIKTEQVIITVAEAVYTSDRDDES